MRKQLYLLSACGFLASSGVMAQSKIKDNTVTGTLSLPRAGAVLELESSNKGLMAPRISLSATTTWGLLGTDSAGMVVYNSNPGITGTTAAPTLGGGVGFYYWDGDRWVGMSAGAGTGDFWRLKGNTATTPPTTVGAAVGAADYWGTADAQNLAVATNGVTRMIFNQSGSAWGGDNSLGDHQLAATSARSFVWGSGDTLLTNGTQIFGNGNYVGATSNATKILGDNNRSVAGVGQQYFIGKHNYNAAASGDANLITGTLDSLVGAVGFNNFIGGLSNLVSNGSYNAVLGQSNKDSSSNIFMAGFDNIIGTNAGASAIMGSSNRIISNGSNQLGQNFIAGAQDTVINDGLVSTAGAFYHANGVFGQKNYISGPNNFSFGVSNKNYAGNATILGGGQNVGYKSDGSAIFGASNIDSASYTLIAGQGNTITSAMQHGAVVGKYNLPVANALFTVGNGSSSSAQQNAFTVTNTQTTGAATNGIIIMSAQLPVYASPAAALADASLPSGAFFRMSSGTPGISTIYMKD